MVGGKNSGYQAIGLAYHYGATKIVLVGYDMKNPGQHWHGDHPHNWGNALGVDDWVSNFYDLAKDLEIMGVDVVNCTIDTAITAFRRDSLEGVFGEL